MNTLGSGFIYYWDWGPNSGSNWLISSNSDGTNRGIESDNVESGATNYTTCLNQVILHIQEPLIQNRFETKCSKSETTNHRYSLNYVKCFRQNEPVTLGSTTARSRSGTLTAPSGSCVWMNRKLEA